MRSAALGGSGNQCWATPRWARPQIIGAVGYGFDLDVCASDTTAYAPNWITKEQDGLETVWEANTVWCNPPWNDIPTWIVRARDQLRTSCRSVVFLVPAQTAAKWFEELFTLSTRVWLITPRLNYWDPQALRLASGVAFGSALFEVTTRSLIRPNYTSVRMLTLRKPAGAVR